MDIKPKFKFYIIHGGRGSPEEPMLKWLADELKKNGFEVMAPAMPDTDEPKIGTWVPFLQNLVGIPNENTFFVGHSIGCQAILRFLETLPEETKIGGAVFIAGWYDVRNIDTEEDRKIVAPWVNTPRNDERIKKILAGKATVLLSDDDPFVAPENKEAWIKKAGAKVLECHGKGHFDARAGITSLPEAFDALLNFRL